MEKSWKALSATQWKRITDVAALYPTSLCNKLVLIRGMVDMAKTEHGTSTPMLVTSIESEWWERQADGGRNS